MNKSKLGIIFLFCFVGLTIFPIISRTENIQASDIEFWYIEDDSIDDTLLNQVNAFETQSGKTVNTTRFTPYEAKEKFKTAFLAGNAPDVIQGSSTWIPEFVTNDMIIPIEETSIIGDYMATALRSVSYYEIKDDVIQGNSHFKYGFPHWVDTQGFVFNTAVAEDMGASIPSIDMSWDTTEFKDAITKMNDQSDPENKKYGFSFGDLLFAAEPLFNGKGGVTFSNYTVDKTHIEIESTESIEALQYLYDLVNKYKLTPDYSEDDISKDIKKIIPITYSGFADDGNIGSTLAFSSEIKHFLEGSQFTQESNLGIAQVPLDEGGSGGPLYVLTLMISKQSSIDKQSVAIELAQALTSTEAMVENAKNEYILPAISSVFEDSELTDNRIVQAYKTILANAAQNPISKYWESTHDIFAMEVGRMLNGDQNSTTTARALGIKWSFLLPANAGYPPIMPVTEQQPVVTSPWSTEALFLAFTPMIFIIYRKKKKR
ncbi:MAG: extracellular solute-binding protein [Candidatus Hodarchaeales archaeon]